MSRSGNKAFDRCDIKVVEFGEYVYLDDTETFYDFKEKVPDSENKIHAGFNAKLHCPRTEDDRISVTSEHVSDMDKVKALISVKKLAGELICHDCRYSCMSPAEVSEDRAKFFRAETEKLNALAALEMARNELQQVTGEGLISPSSPPEITS